ncbi:membrane-associated, eicosanoid/glutathione metabolism protein [Phyllosticta capitalensis]|uniref:membrane-associated, eicosanoid/glutathione metabolism protein n=1 Tax=Phyllosticta capitalensis TaxID=121624 RepID=UPI00312E2D98
MVTLGLGIPMPMLAPITATWSAPFAVYLVVLSSRIVYHRIKDRTKTLDVKGATNSEAPETDPLYVATRAHANFVENVPLALTLSALAELNGGSRRLLHGALAALLVMRVAHVELGLRSSFRGVRSIGPGRAVGYYGTQAMLVGLAGYGAWVVREYWGF